MFPPHSLTRHRRRIMSLVVDTLSTSDVLPKPCSNLLYNFRMMDQAGVQAMQKDPFVPFCWKNPSIKVEHGHEWLPHTLEQFIPRKTVHRAKLSPGSVQQTGTWRAGSDKIFKLIEVEHTSQGNPVINQDNLFASRTTDNFLKHLNSEM